MMISPMERMEKLIAEQAENHRILSDANLKMYVNNLYSIRSFAIAIGASPEVFREVEQAILAVPPVR